MAVIQSKFLDFDAGGKIWGMTIKHAIARADIPHFSFEQIAA